MVSAVGVVVFDVDVGILNNAVVLGVLPVFQDDVSI